VLIILLIFIDNVWVAAPFLILLGALGGFLVVPMNALLQHRGHNLMGAGRSIAVQNFNEQACILAWARLQPVGRPGRSAHLRRHHRLRPGRWPGRSCG
jgi:LPLT family lysophospholipid transporter-like MFS transporter